MRDMLGKDKRRKARAEEDEKKGEVEGRKGEE